MMDVNIRAIVTGTVQGVGFRYTARQFALQLDIKGSVKNLSDGSVEIYAEGSSENVDKFLTSLKEHFGEYVRNIIIEPVTIGEVYSDFHIIH